MVKRRLYSDFSETVHSSTDCAIEKAWLRAVAGTSLLKLCYIQKYSHMLGADMFVTLSSLMKDEVDCVRGYFVRRLNKGISRNRLTIEYLSFFSIVALLEPTSTEEENAIKLYREQCRNALLAAIARRRNLIQSPSFVAMYLPYHQPEYSIAYAAWLLSHQEILSTHSDIANMAVLQECLWFIMEPFMTKKEITDFEFIYCLLQDIKDSNDALFDKRQKKGEIGDAELVGQCKKMWALADLGMLMLVYRGKVTIRNEPRKTLLSTRFFVKEKKSKHGGIVYAPQELIEDEKERNGKVPTRDRKRLNNTSKLTSSKRSIRESKNTTKSRRGRVPSVKLDKIDESSRSPEEVSPLRKGTDRKPMGVEQENVPIANKVDSSPKISEEKQKQTTHRISTRNRAKGKNKLAEANQSVTSDEDDTSPSTSGEHMQTRSSALRKDEETNAVTVTPTKKTGKAGNSPLKRVSGGNDIISSQNEDSGISPWPRKRQRSVLNNVDDAIDFSPIVRSGQKVTRSRGTRSGPISTSTPLPKTIKKSHKRGRPTKEKNLDVLKTQKSEKEIKTGSSNEAKTAVQIIEKQSPKKEARRKKTETEALKTRANQRSNITNGSASPISTKSLRSSKTRKSSSPPKPPARLKRSQRTSGKVD